ncbi:hypothetical protein [uncultured Clostridium sp.]|uniref:hypothetical protein n=1 Tax=uncultured Clostridium sp. TaxID=59620 RepID=UPI0025EC4721|nr:hypothetical protein [uncultured Clostridium sp.]
MGKKEIELLPSGLVSCIINGREVRILKISPEKLAVRFSSRNEDIKDIKLAFYIFDEYRYEEIGIMNFNIDQIIEERFCFKYVFSIDDKEYSENVRKVFRNYSRYIMLKSYGDENEFSHEMVGYPADKDYDFSDYYSHQKKEWMSELEYKGDSSLMEYVELALKIDNDTLWEKYLAEDIRNFKEYYLKENHAENNELFKKDVSRIYIGNEFCHNLFPELNILINILDKAEAENLEVTLCFTYMRDCYIEKTEQIIDEVHEWCIRNNKKIEIIINDWGMLKLLKDKKDVFTLSLGVLLNKRKKDPRYMYKKGYVENKEMMSQNNLNIELFRRFLKENGIQRYEYENCGYRVSIAEGKHSLHMPFYVTNTSQYCTLYAMCTNLDRGKQKLVKSCPKYCREYVFAYPKHLKMVGKYNSLFAFDDTLMKDFQLLEYYLKSGIDRIVLNFI